MLGIRGTTPDRANNPALGKQVDRAGYPGSTVRFSVSFSLNRKRPCAKLADRGLARQR